MLIERPLVCSCFASLVCGQVFRGKTWNEAIDTLLGCV